MNSHLEQTEIDKHYRESLVQELLEMAESSSDGTSGQKILMEFVQTLRNLNREAVRYWLDREEATLLIEHILFDEELYD